MRVLAWDGACVRREAEKIVRPGSVVDQFLFLTRNRTCSAFVYRHQVKRHAFRDGRWIGKRLQPPTLHCPRRNHDLRGIGG